MQFQFQSLGSLHFKTVVLLRQTDLVQLGKEREKKKERERKIKKMVELGPFSLFSPLICLWTWAYKPKKKRPYMLIITNVCSTIRIIKRKQKNCNILKIWTIIIKLVFYFMNGDHSLLIDFMTLWDGYWSSVLVICYGLFLSKKNILLLTFDPRFSWHWLLDSWI